MNLISPPDYYREEVYSLTKLPTIPAIATEILQVTREDNLSVSQIIPIIKRDPPLALKILKIANSAYYGLRDRVETLQRAIVVIGMEELSHLVLSFTVLKLLLSRDISDQWIEWRELWEHSAACGHIAQLLDKRLGLRIHSSPYSLGLLHDVGKLVLYRLDPDKYIDAVKLAEVKQITSSESEYEVFGVTHTDVGKWLAEKWELPEAIIYSIGYHHNPETVPKGEYQASTALIQISDLVCNFKSFRFGTSFVRSIPREEAGWKILQAENEGLKDMDFERFVLEIDDDIDTIRKMVELTRM